MYYLFDNYGWYIGSSDVLHARSTIITPSSENTGTGIRANFTGYSWVLAEYVPPNTSINLGIRREAAWTQTKAIRDLKVQTGGYTVGGKWYHSDTFSRTQQMGLVMMGASVPPIQWKTMDGSFVTMTQTLAGQIFAAAAAQDQALFANAEVIHAAILASEDPESVDLTAGWPTTFTG